MHGERRASYELESLLCAIVRGDVKRVPETIPAGQAAAHGVKLDQKARVPTADELADYDAIVFGTPTRFGNIAGRMRTFLDQTGGLWMKGALAGKIGSVFA